MSDVDLNEIIRIVDDEIDVDAIMAEIKANLASRPKLVPDPSGLTYTAADGIQSELEFLVEEAEDAGQDLAIGDQLRPGVGLVGTLATRAKRPLHDLARFYAGMVAQRQSAVNRPVQRALALLTKRSEAAKEEIAALRTEVAALRAELDELKGQRPTA